MDLHVLCGVAAGFAGASLWSGAVRAWRWGAGFRWRLYRRLGLKPDWPRACGECGERFRDCDCVPF